jgi:hypothetical protein
VRYTFVTTNPAYSQMNIGVRVTYGIISVLILMLWVIFIIMRLDSYQSWPSEVKGCLALIVALQFFNNPLHPIEYFTSGWILPFLNAELELLFIVVLLGFWIYQCESLRGHLGMQAPTSGFFGGAFWQHRTKLVAVGVFAALNTAFFVWESVHNRMTPIFGISEHVTGLQILFYFASVSYAVVVVWTALSIIMAIPKAFSQDQMSIRYIFFAVPTGLVMASMLIGIFSGSLISFGRSTLNFMYYHTLMQCYVYLMLWGFWPTQSRYQNLAPTETSNIFDESKTKNYL